MGIQFLQPFVLFLSAIGLVLSTWIVKLCTVPKHCHSIFTL